MKDPFGTERDGNGKKIGTPSGVSELKAMLERINENFISALHENSGICGHCGKRYCAGRSTNSGLPKTLNTDDVLAAIAVSLSKASSNAGIQPSERSEDRLE
ncbi:MAG: hypothetical protein ACYC1K_03515 [Minisyncoccota bacterium]